MALTVNERESEELSRIALIGTGSYIGVSAVGHAVSMLTDTHQKYLQRFLAGKRGPTKSTTCCYEFVVA